MTITKQLAIVPVAALIAITVQAQQVPTPADQAAVARANAEQDRQSQQQRDEGYAVSHNVMQVRIPRPGSTGSVTAGLLPWPPTP